MPVDVCSRVDVAEQAEVAAAARTILELLGKRDWELSIALIDDGEMRVLNRRWRGKDRPTDVLSFAAGDAGAEVPAPAAASGVPLVLGDVVVSVDTARRQAEEGGWTLAEELNRLVLHGILHLLGYDHEAGPLEAERMRAEERRLAACLLAAGFGCARETSTPGEDDS